MQQGVAGKLTIACLLGAIAIVFWLPLKKQLWYDETVSMQCAKGISHDAPAQFAGARSITSADLAALNTPGNVFAATVSDNANSYLYNIGLHWFTQLFGNGVGAYVWFSKLIAAATLIAFYFLCRLLLGDGVFTVIAILLLVADINFMGMSREVRAYSMGMLFVTLAAIYCFKFLRQSPRPVWLLLTGVFSAAAVLTHFLAVYIILVFLLLLVIEKRTELLKGRNLLAIAVPVVMLGVFFLLAYPGLQTMDRQNHEIQQRALAAGFSNAEVLKRALKFTAINFKVVFPSFLGNWPMILGSFVLVIAFCITGVKLAGPRKKELQALFMLSAGGSIFLALLCVKSHHYTALYYRYFSFCLPFCCLFAATLLQVFSEKNKWLFQFTAALLILPSVALFTLWASRNNPPLKYNFPQAAAALQAAGATKIEVPTWRDAFLINCVLPAGYKIEYFRNPAATAFSIYDAKGGVQQIPVIRIDD